MDDRDRDPEGEAGTSGGVDAVEPVVAAADAVDAVASVAPSGDAVEPVAPVAPVPGADRRAFLRQLSGDAVTTAGRFAGLSSALRRSVFVAGQTAVNGLEAIAAGSGPAELAPSDPAVADAQTTAPPAIEPRVATGSSPRLDPSVAAVPSTAAPADESPAPAAPATAPVIAAPQPPDPALSLTPDQQRFLADALHAIVAVTDPAGPPHLTSSAYHWDGAIFRLPGQMFTARATYLDRDSRVSLLIGQPGARESVMVSGLASSVYGDEVEADMLSILAREMTPDAAVEAWSKLRASGDRMVVRIRPTRFVWRRT